MKLRTFNQTNSKSHTTGILTVRVSEKTGLFSFSKAASELLGLMDGDGILVSQDEDSPAAFFIHKSTDPEAFMVRIKKSSSAFAFNCTSLAILLLDKGVGKKHLVKLNRTESFLVGIGQVMPQVGDLTLYPITPINK